MEPSRIEVDKVGFYAAMEALMMDDPHPGYDYQDSPSHWLRRALYAYEWAKHVFLADSRGFGLRREVPPPGEAREAVLFHERLEHEQWSA
ncbi:hypothetical protein AB0C34_06195 [Nocardia sp. NPDC049220]|uniref:hypothetical protein n=1 Tax=Nocardia sp. NPDC049220 TaxID=3155273 RepID=UPI0033E5C851